MMNILNGGAHADSSVDLQEFMVVPVGAAHASPRACAWAPRCSTPCANVLHERGLATGVGDEGGFAPNLPSNQDALDDDHGSDRSQAGYKPGGRSPSPSTPPRASSSRTAHYVFRKSDGSPRTSGEMVGF